MKPALKTFPPSQTQAKAAAKRWRVYLNGVLMAGSADEDAARRIAAVIGGCEVRSS